MFVYIFICWRSALWDSEKFIAFVGLNSLPTSSAADVSDASDDPAHVNRINVCIFHR